MNAAALRGMAKAGVALLPPEPNLPDHRQVKKTFAVVMANRSTTFTTPWARKGFQKRHQ